MCSEMTHKQSTYVKVAIDIGVLHRIVIHRKHVGLRNVKIVQDPFAHFHMSVRCGHSECIVAVGVDMHPPNTEMFDDPFAHLKMASFGCLPKCFVIEGFDVIFCQPEFVRKPSADRQMPVFRGAAQYHVFVGSDIGGHGGMVVQLDTSRRLTDTAVMQKE